MTIVIREGEAEACPDFSYPSFTRDTVWVNGEGDPSIRFSSDSRAKSRPKSAQGICRTKAYYPYCAYNDRWPKVPLFPLNPAGPAATIAGASAG